jgi:hypothetical protein
MPNLIPFYINGKIPFTPIPDDVWHDTPNAESGWKYATGE